ncbi:MAG: Lrp/AsnC family transcriptional regulator [Candidatus Acidiferrales bacterium]
MANMSLDRIDFEIIRLLQKNARLSNKEIAASVRLAPSTCHERIKNLQATGVIRGAHADIDLRALGLTLEALFFIELAKHERAVVDRFLSETESIPEVRRAFLVSGHYDLVVHVAVKDIEHLRNLAFDRFTSQPVVVKIETSIVFDSRARNELAIPREGARNKRASRASQLRAK